MMTAMEKENNKQYQKVKVLKTSDNQKKDTPQVNDSQSLESNEELETNGMSSIPEGKFNRLLGCG